jgi:uncharacterized protein
MNVTGMLCTGCGLCCDGSLFSDVELASAKEISGLEALGVQIEDGDSSTTGLLVQPCSALQGKRCGIYPHRPKCCRTFECRLLKEVQTGTVTIEQAQETITIIRREISTIKGLMGTKNSGLPLKERYHEAMTLIAEQGESPAAEKRGTELMRRMGILEALIKEKFLKPLRYPSEAPTRRSTGRNSVTKT